MLITGELCGVRASMGTLCTFCSNLLWMVLLYKVKSIKERERIGIGGRQWIIVYGFAPERSRKLSSSWQGSGGSGERLPASLRWESSNVCGKKVDLLWWVLVDAWAWVLLPGWKTSLKNRKVGSHFPGGEICFWVFVGSLFCWLMFAQWDENVRRIWNKRT